MIKAFWKPPGSEEKMLSYAAPSRREMSLSLIISTLFSYGLGSHSAEVIICLDPLAIYGHHFPEKLRAVVTAPLQAARCSSAGGTARAPTPPVHRHKLQAKADAPPAPPETPRLILQVREEPSRGNCVQAPAGGLTTALCSTPLQWALCSSALCTVHHGAQQETCSADL